MGGTPLQRIHQERRETAASFDRPLQRTEVPDAGWWLDKIHCGDVLDTLAAMPDECVDLVVTSPPYNALQTTGGGWRHGLGKWGKASLLKTGYDSHSDRMDPDNYVAWQQECLRAMMRVVKPDGAILYNHRPRVQGDRYEDHARDIVSVAEEGGFALRQVILWDRGSGFNHNAGYFLPSYEEIFLLAKPGRFRHRGLGRVQNVWRVKPDRQRGVPALPVDLIRIPLATLRPSYDAPPVVLDPFVGSGSVAAAAVLEDWRYVGIDISDEYCRQARNRVQVALQREDTQREDTQREDTQREDTQREDTQREDTQREDTQREDTQREDTQREDTQREDTQREDTQREDTQREDTQDWSTVPVRWESLDKAVYDRVVEIQKATRLQAVKLNQNALACEFGCSLRSLNGAIAKLKNAGILTAQRWRGPSLYSASSEIPRWPVRVAGGLGTTSKDTQREDTQEDTQTRVPDREPGLINQANLSEINPVPGTGVPARAREDAGGGHVAPDAAICPLHTQVNRQRVTTYRPLAAIMQATGDEIRYCYGSGGQCSWVHSRELGQVVAAGGRRLDAQGIEAAYYDLRSAAQPAGSNNQDTSRTGYIEEVRDLYGGRLPWETTEEAAN